jgi:hypothetical protein
MAAVGGQRDERGCGRSNESGRGEEEVAVMTAAAMSLHRRRAVNNATRSDGGVVDNATSAGGEDNGKRHFSVHCPGVQKYLDRGKNFTFPVPLLRNNIYFLTFSNKRLFVSLIFLKPHGIRMSNEINFSRFA